jgi:hypothetical protein
MNNSKLQAGLHELQETGAFEFIVHRYRADGATCLAISGDDIDMTQIGFALAKHTEAFREATEHFPKARQVSMVGHGRVHYWPDVPYETLHRKSIEPRAQPPQDPAQRAKLQNAVAKADRHAFTGQK